MNNNPIEEDIANLFLQCDPRLDIKSKVLINVELPFKNLNYDLPTLFNREEVIYTKISKSGHEDVIMKITYEGKEDNKKSYLYSSLDNKGFYTYISISISIYRKITSLNNKIEYKIISNKTYSHTEIRIPQYIAHGGNTSENDNSITQSNNPGGFFNVSKSLKKMVTTRIEQTYIYPKRKKTQKAYTYHLAFISKKPSFMMINEKLNPPQFLTLDIDFNPDKIKCVIDSKKTFLQIDIIALIIALSNDNIDVVYKKISSGFSDDISDSIKILIENTKNILSEYNNDARQYVDKIIEINYIKKYPKNEITLQDYFNNIFNDFLPHIGRGKYNEKCMYMISILRQSFVSIFQSDVYPDKDNLATRRISTAADIFENIIRTSIDNSFELARDKYKTYISGSGKNNNINNILSQVKLLPQITQAFNNFFNMQDTKNSDVVKIGTHSNWAESIYISNAVERGVSIELTKSLTQRKLHASSINVLDMMDTPDHGTKTGLVKRLCISTLISHYPIHIRKQLFEEVREFIENKVKHTLKEDIISGVFISIIDESEHVIARIKNSETESFIKDLKYAKISGLFVKNDIGIEILKFHELDNNKQIYVPTDRYFQIRINVGNKRATQPVFRVENGELAFNKYPNLHAELKESNSYTDFVTKYYDIIEVIDVGQMIYSNMCNTVTEFNSYSLEQRKKYDYVRLPNYLYFSYLTSTGCMYDIGKMTGVRGTFGTAQSKHIITGPPDNVMNKYDTCNYLAYPIERPSITNIPMEISGIARNSIGTHVLVGFFSFNYNVEDGVIVNKESINRGLLSVISLMSVKNELSDTQINNNNPSAENSNNNYSKISATGLPSIGTVLVQGDALYRCLKPKFKNDDDNRYIFDQSETLSNTYPAVVERTRKQGTDLIKIDMLLSSYRRLSVGDKIAKSVQKVTVSKIMEEEDMPYNENGERPDIIFNSPSIISRKTLPLYDEVSLCNMFSKIPYNDKCDVEYINYPIYTDKSPLDKYNFIKKELKKIYNNVTDEELENIIYCRQTLYHPYTKKPMTIKEGDKETKSFMGPMLFCRLSQMSADKISVRNRGRLDKYMQAPSGKKKGGGIKIGEMESDVFATNGSVYAIHELQSDPDEFYLPAHICGNCGIFATYEENIEVKRWKCLQCENLGLSPEIIKMRLTYATKIFITLLNARGISLIPVKDNQSIRYISDDNTINT
ncbi:DNA-directed RNA polymerase subunit [Betaentomopoxvirus amoorei]|uniref:DNA-directed RNA polymerase n=1 Tax=Amsacta moorei entomopoxvirus TaxID=28321 RepID=Q9EMY3_AMEPV|nr:DNA-directed RNA polymerase subunit [Amsacta moorei entomopoxvirus]AAG02772.1 AMV066 [Amsacta moorei entomopoxvirus]